VIGGPLASADPGPALVDSILADLDSGDGWVSSSADLRSWYPGRLRIDFTLAPGPTFPTLAVDVVVVRNASRQPAILNVLDDLNVHAAGWWWWIDPVSGDISASMRCVVKSEDWWWPQVIHEVLPWFATVTESVADRLALATDGGVAAAPHPQRGPREHVDEWITNCRMGQREPIAALDIWLSTLECNRLLSAVDTLAPGAGVHLGHPLAILVLDPDHTRVVLRRHWHPELGWGWQLASLPSLAADDRTEARNLAAELNFRQAKELHRNRLGGWIALEGLGLVHQTFIPAFVAEGLLRDAGSNIGDVIALILETRERWNDIIDAGGGGPEPGADALEELRRAPVKSGPIGFSYLASTAEDQADEPLNPWLVPRHLPICTYGYFNPMGPTVNSLEAAMQPGGSWRLWHVLRHPLCPEITLVGEGEELDDLIANAVRDPEIVGSGPDWLEIHAYREAVMRGAYEYAASDDDTDWRAEADALVWFSSDPWARVSGPDEPPADASRWPTDADPAACWVEAITDLDVIAGHQLYLRSAWEGAAAYAASEFEDPDAAQRVCNAVKEISRQRALADFHFRNDQLPFVKHPSSRNQGA